MTRQRARAKNFGPGCSPGGNRVTSLSSIAKLVNFYHFAVSKEIFLRSLDARSRDLASAIHWAVSDDLGKRTYFQIGNGHQAKLKVTKVAYRDQGIFRCRVDFINSPTRNFRVNLTLVGEFCARRVLLGDLSLLTANSICRGTIQACDIRRSGARGDRGGRTLLGRLQPRLDLPGVRRLDSSLLARTTRAL